MLARIPYQYIINFALFQTIWFAGALWANSSLWITLPCLIALCLNIKIGVTDLKLLSICAVLGLIIDGSLIQSGLFILPSTSSWLPLWLWLIWLAFALTLRHSLSYIIGNTKLAFVAGAIFGPVAYNGGKALGAIEFGLPNWVISLILASIWGVIMLGLSLWLKHQPSTTACN
ncbi:DUF2878 domain-containing protein [Catenovulum adriaticum]|uniref:DUF2878 domain-containing protein n=1 Tax=Catenovulum adriaticum TaxID=2984846 RepID=A0ABY7AMS1_9ALTE|nr:DUF2878 domain-containing protein [Catenovulum sp. TS8]WAJ70032.1 DUF2878 domain-containing protein [Catenovulum sp. TS8]